MMCRGFWNVSNSVNKDGCIWDATGSLRMHKTILSDGEAKALTKELTYSYFYGILATL